MILHLGLVLALTLELEKPFLSKWKTKWSVFFAADKHIWKIIQQLIYKYAVYFQQDS